MPSCTARCARAAAAASSSLVFTFGFGVLQAVAPSETTNPAIKAVRGDKNLPSISSSLPLPMPMQCDTWLPSIAAAG
jgi:hypothetical protein